MQVTKGALISASKNVPKAFGGWVLTVPTGGAYRPPSCIQGVGIGTGEGNGETKKGRGREGGKGQVEEEVGKGGGGGVDGKGESRQSFLKVGAFATCC